MSFKCVVIDDEQYAVDAMAKYIGHLPNFVVHQTYTNPLLALQSIVTEDAIDFIFLDIEMPELSGLELAESLRSKTRFLIFTTSHPKHALTAFNLQASQYLLKPISFAKFAAAVNFLVNSTQSISAIPIPQKTIAQFIKADHKNAFHYINPEDILYIQAAKNYIYIYTDAEHFVTHMGLSHIEAALGMKDFIRISKSYIIAKRAIKKIEGNCVRLKNNESFQIGETYKTDFFNFMKANMVATK
jgi:two-component system LytT family response regulator